MRMTDAELLKKYGIDIDLTMLYTDNPTHLISYVRDLIKRSLNDLESTAKSWKSLGEVEITNMLCNTINANSFFTASCEKNANGHVDLTIESANMCSTNIFNYKGEAKIWKGPQYSLDGFKQLMKYLTGQPPIAFFLYYFRKHTCDDHFADYLNTVTSKFSGTNLSRFARFATTQHPHKSSATYELDHFAAWIPNVEKMIPFKVLAPKKTTKKATKKVAKNVTKKTAKKVAKKTTKKATKTTSPKRKN